MLLRCKWIWATMKMKNASVIPLEILLTYVLIIYAGCWRYFAVTRSDTWTELVSKSYTASMYKTINNFTFIMRCPYYCWDPSSNPLLSLSTISVQKFCILLQNRIWRKTSIKFCKKGPWMSIMNVPRTSLARAEGKNQASKQQASHPFWQQQQRTVRESHAMH